MFRNIILVASVMFVQVAWVASQEDCGGFTCPSSDFCIPPHWICDGDNDCRDMSDETDCDSKCEEANGYYCKEDEKCILAEWYCDQFIDCPSGEDEKDCDYPTYERKKRSLKENSAMLSEMFKKK